MDRNLLKIAFCFLALLTGASATFADDQEPALPVDEEGRVVDFVRDIAPILSKRCLSCHGPEDAKNDFRVDDPDTLFQYVEPEDLESSTLYTDYLITHSLDELMPPSENGGPLSAAELALIRVWIEEGAVWPDGAVLTADAPPPPKENKPAPKSLSQRIWAFQGFLHPATVHFPIALLLFGAFFVVLGWKWPKLGTQIPLACLLLGAPSAVAATLMGWSFASQQGYAGWQTIDMDSEAFWHRWSGVIVTVLSTILAIIALISLRREETRLTSVWKVGLLVVAGMVGAVGHQGGEMSYGKDFYPKAFRILLGQTEEANDADTNDGDAGNQSKKKPAEVAEDAAQDRPAVGDLSQQ